MISKKKKQSEASDADGSFDMIKGTTLRRSMTDEYCK